ncbi:MAG TPA: hypothetical protein VHZ33_09440 [Trebonia sp.]|jgi:hypothetical protein|nr:hypothetical protein [Trebonia sp.]
MPNINDAEITGIYVSQTVPGGIQDDAPNAPVGGGNTPGTAFDVTLEMVAGTALFSEVYTLTVSCTDVTTTADAAGLVPAFPPAAPSTIGAPPWKSAGSYYTYEDNQTVTVPAGAGGGQVYRYTASLVTANGEVASIKQSDLFVLY